MTIMSTDKTTIQKSIFFTYSHRKITEIAAANALNLDRLEFRKAWTAYLKANEDVALSTGNGHYLNA